MSLSRPVKFPLLKLPWLCIKCVLHNSDEFILIYFATISDRTRRIVKSSNCPIKEIDVGVSRCNRIRIKDQLGYEDNEKIWFFKHDKYAYDDEFVLQMGSQPIRTREYLDCWGDDYLYSYTVGDTLNALKMGIEFMIDVFGCKIRQVMVSGDKLSELFELGINSASVLRIDGHEPVNLTDLNYLLENVVKVSEKYVFYAPIPEAFYCEPQTFKSQQLFFFGNNSADWVTLELLCQFDVPQFAFWFHRFSFGDIVSYVAHWFNSENRKLEYVQFELYNPSQEDFKIDDMNPMPFCEKRRNRCPFVGEWKGKDMSSGKDILRQDGLLATFYVDSTSVIFYIWHKRFPDAI